MRALILVAGAALATGSCHNDGTANSTMNVDDTPMAVQQNVPSSPNNVSPPAATDDEETSTASTADEESASSASSSSEEE